MRSEQAQRFPEICLEPDARVRVRIAEGRREARAKTWLAEDILQGYGNQQAS
jgi:hypothetical protein